MRLPGQAIGCRAHIFLLISRLISIVTLLAFQGIFFLSFFLNFIYFFCILTAFPLPPLLSFPPHCLISIPPQSTPPLSRLKKVQASQRYQQSTAFQAAVRLSTFLVSKICHALSPTRVLLAIIKFSLFCCIYCELRRREH